MNIGWIKVFVAALLEFIWITGFKYAAAPAFYGHDYLCGNRPETYIVNGKSGFARAFLLLFLQFLGQKIFIPAAGGQNKGKRRPPSKYTGNAAANYPGG